MSRRSRRPWSFRRRTVRSLETVHRTVAELEQRVAEQSEQRALLLEVARSLRAEATAISESLTQLETRLSEQINELERSLTTAREGSASLDDIESVLKDLKASQEHLATEQARYQIAFRDDLAYLLDDLY